MFKPVVVVVVIAAADVRRSTFEGRRVFLGVAIAQGRQNV